MPANTTTELLLIRHAPALTQGRMAGRRDVAADCSDVAGFAALREKLGHVGHRLSSPAVRCKQTASVLWPGHSPVADARLWEQDFGAWEDMPFGDLPDLGPLSTDDLANSRPPHGESFTDLYDRVLPALREATTLGGRVALIVHAGVIRAALGMALGKPAAGLCFDVAPLSLTSITAFPGGVWSIGAVNWMPR